MSTKPKTLKLSLLKLKPQKFEVFLGRTKAVNAEGASARSGLGSATHAAVTAGLSPLQLSEEAGHGLHAPAYLSLRPLVPLEGGCPPSCFSHHEGQGPPELLPA